MTTVETTKHDSSNQSHTTTWKDNIDKLNKNSECKYKYEIDVDNDEYVSNEQQNNIKAKLKGLSQYSSILNLHETFQDKNDPNKLSLMHINLNSLNGDGHFDAFVTNLCLFERLPDIICITESRLKNEDDLEKFKIPNYHLYVKNRNGRGDGGVAMYVNNTFKVLARNDLAYFKDQVYESLFLEIRTQNPDFCLVCGVVYRTNVKDEKTLETEKEVDRPKQTENQDDTTPTETQQKATSPKTKKGVSQTNTLKQTSQKIIKQKEAHDEFLTQLKKTVAILKKNDTKACICGDFNYDLMHQGDKEKHKHNLKSYKKVMYNNNFFPCIYRPTRIAGKKTKEKKRNEESTTMQSENIIPYSSSRKSIDHIWCNDLNLVSNSAILVDAFWSDHLAVCCSLQTDKSHFAKKFKLNESNFKKLSDALLEHNWKEIEEDPQDAVDQLKKTVIKIFKVHAENMKSKLSKFLQQENVKPNALEETDISENLETVTENFEKEYSKAVEKLTWSYKQKSEEELFKNVVKVLENAINDLECISFSSSWIEFEDLSLDDQKEKHQTALNIFTDFLVNVSQNTKDAWDEVKRTHKKFTNKTKLKVRENAEKLNNIGITQKLAEKADMSVAVADVIGPVLDPYQLTLSYARFLNDVNDTHFGCAARYLSQLCPFTNTIFPLNILFLLPNNQVHDKVFQLLAKIFSRSLENIQAERNTPDLTPE